ncbi:hypothetical protein POKO110462_11005 [Pontibacter korlensis]|uniref:STAS/SEC14 domain-containing protein n=1 Tax=Pontibacter korlensis TaxID=400092 RepID=A0A0E3ZIF2_9BACT|nr:hypothetical protein [Pontibacter korlensis]AKD04623.1 hypothetical protein PKOR_17875 [Pontibacter korlensis]
MILFENGVIKLEYLPASDILELAYPDLHEFILPEIKNSVDVLVGNAINYDVKKVLPDSSRTLVEVNDEKSRETTVYLIEGLMKTRISKLAKLQSGNSVVEITAQNNISHVLQSMPLTFDLRSFSNKADALKWLEG